MNAILRLFLFELLIVSGALCTSSGDLRLVDYYSSNGGRLEMYQYVSGYGYYTWISFNINSFNSMHNADLACQKLGYTHASRYATVGTLGYEGGSGSYCVGSVTCSQYTTSFSSCSHSINTYCSHYEDLALICTNTTSSLRLVTNSGYVTSLSGRLEILINNTWGTVCDDNFLSTQATVACHQLGYSTYSTYGSASNLGYPTYLSSSTPIWLDNLYHCNSYSSDLRTCTDAVGYNDCSHSEDIILTCFQGSTTYQVPYTTATSPSSGDLRLINYYGSTMQSSGRLEMYYFSSWTSFCSTNFDSHEADLACQKLGYSRASRYGRVGDLGFSQGSSYYTLSLRCSNSDTSFSSCSHSQTYCSHSYDVGLFCTASNGDLRLISYGNPGGSGGRLEMYHSSSWTTFCYLHFSRHEGDLACQKLGYARVSQMGRVDFLGYDQGSGSITLSLNCPDYYSSFSSCSHSDLSTYSCSHFNDVSLVCTNYGTTYAPPYYTSTPSRSNGDIRLVGGYQNYLEARGRLEMYHSYVWTTYCSEYFNAHEADLACQKLGYTRASSYGRVGDYGYSEGSSYITIKLNCNSYDSSFSYCSHSDYSTTYCSHYYDVALVCINTAATTYSPTPYTDYTYGNLRLKNRGSPDYSSGQLEMYYSHTWIPICITGLSHQDAKLACKSLGYEDVSSYHTISYYWYEEGSGNLSLTVNCPDDATSFRECDVTMIDSCSFDNNVLLSCDWSGDSHISHLVLSVSIAVPLVVVCSALCIGGIICTTVAAAVYKKKKRNGTSQYNPVQQAPPVNYRMSDLASADNQPEVHLFRPISSTRSTPVPASVNLEHAPMGNNSEDAGSDGNVSDDEQPLIA